MSAGTERSYAHVAYFPADRTLVLAFGVSHLRLQASCTLPQQPCCCMMAALGCLQRLQNLHCNGALPCSLSRGPQHACMIDFLQHLVALRQYCVGQQSMLQWVRPNLIPIQWPNQHGLQSIKCSLDWMSCARCCIAGRCHIIGCIRSTVCCVNI